MRKINILYLFAILMVASCDYLEEEPLYYQTPADKFLEEKNVEFAMNMCYHYLPDGYFRVSGSLLDAATDDAIFRTEDGGINKISRGLITSSDPILNEWSQMYKGINQTLMFESNLHYMIIPRSGTTTDPIAYLNGKRKEFKAESNMLRAYYYFELLKIYGGVPLIKEQFTLDQNAREVGRATFGEVVDYIVELCDSASINHPDDVNQVHGRWGKGAALAIKAKTLAYAASDLYNAGVESDLNGYTSGSQLDRQKAAATALAEVINMDAYELYNSYYMFNLPIPYFKEYIVYRGLPKSNGIERKLYPPSYDGNGTVFPTQEFVDAFNNADGSKYVPGSKTGADQWLNRDPRLKQIVVCDGDEIRIGKPVQTARGEGETLDGIGVVYEKSTSTGYYLKKFVNSTIDFDNASAGTTYHIFPYIRYADILLLYAEMMNEAYGPTTDNGYGLTALQAIEMVRQRAGLFPYQLDQQISKSELFDAIKNERRVELCFEEQRYFDLRRWKDAKDVLNKELHGTDILNQGGNKIYNKVVVDSKRKFEDKMYFAPIPYGEVQSLDIPQNPLW